MKKAEKLSLVVFILAVVVFLAYYLVYYIPGWLTRDRTAPVIAMSSAQIEISAEDDVTAILSGVTASDTKDGDVSSSLVVESLGDFDAEGARVATLAAIDKAGNVARVTRTVTYSDYVSPTFWLKGALRFPAGSTDLVNILRVTDIFEGYIYKKIQVFSPDGISEDSVGDYPLEISLTNGAGDTVSMTATVTIYEPDSTAPVIDLSTYLVYTTVGQSLQPWWDYVDGVEEGDTLWSRTDEGVLHASGQEDITSDDFVIEGSVDFNTPGSYEITYRYSDKGEEGYTRLIVLVREG